METKKIKINCHKSNIDSPCNILNNYSFRNVSIVFEYFGRSIEYDAATLRELRTF